MNKDRKNTFRVDSFKCFHDDRFKNKTVIKLKFNDDDLLSFINHLPIEQTRLIVNTFEKHV